LIDSLREQTKNNSRQGRKMEREKSPSYEENPVLRLGQENDHYRVDLQKELIRYLQIRQQQRLESTFETKMMAEIERLATIHLNEYLATNKGASPRAPPISCIWMGNLRQSQIPGEFGNIGLTKEKHRIIQEGRNLEKNNSGSKSDLYSFKTLIQRYDSYFKPEDIQAIRNMFAQDFGDAVAIDSAPSLIQRRSYMEKYRTSTTSRS
jgi:hypothetical protein